MDSNRNTNIRAILPRAILIILTVLVYVGTPFWYAIWDLLSGHIFLVQWDRRWAGFALDQPTIGKYFFWFTVMAVILLASAAILRRFSDVSSRLGYWLFAVPMILIWLLLVCMLMDSVVLLSKYIGAMGWTPKRVIALVYGIGWFVFMLIFLRRVLKS